MCLYRSQKQIPTPFDDFADMKFDEDLDFSDNMSQSLLSLDHDSLYRSDLDSSLGKLSDVDSMDMQDNKITKSMSTFSKFKQNSGDSKSVSSNESDNEEDVKDETFKLADVTKPKRAPKTQKKKRRRRDVVFKKILRECRRFFQSHLNELTGFVASKKTRSDDHFYTCMEKFNQEFLDLEGTFEHNFYLACLLYPQDLSRNVNIFIAKREEPSKENQKYYKSIVARIHDTLYKYSHEKLDYFVSIPELSFLFMYFYENGAASIRADPKLMEECEYIKSK